MTSCCFFILSAVVTVQSSVIRKPPSVPALFQFNPNDNEPSSLLLKRSECEDAAAIRDTLEKASLNFQDCEDVTPSHECVSDTLGAIAGCYKDLAIDSDCVQETFDVSEDIRIVVFKLTICTYFCFLETSKWYPNTVFLSRMEKVSVHDFRC